MEDCCLAYGQISPASCSLQDLCRLLKGSAASVQIRESSHYTEGQYLLIEATDGALITIERIEPTELLLSGEACTPAQLAAICQEASVGLTAGDWRHRIELYSTDNQQFLYLHHRWSQGR